MKVKLKPFACDSRTRRIETVDIPDDVTAELLGALIPFASEISRIHWGSEWD